MAEANHTSRGRYYDIAVAVTPVAGVTHTIVDSRRDAYRGTAEALSAMRLLPLSLFPGMPGQNGASARFRPRGVARGGRCWCFVPGYLEVFRRPQGSYRIVLVVSEEERAWREAREEAIEAAGDDAAEEVLRTIRPAVREYLERAVATSGGRYWVRHFFRDKAFLKTWQGSPEDREKILFGLKAMDLADERRALAIDLERSLDQTHLSEAESVLSRFGMRHS